MKKTNKIIYWTTTLFLSVGMLAGGIQQMLQIGGYNEIVTKLGYPLYLLSIIGTWKILGVIAILIPKYPLLKEWAYAGFFFAMTGAVASHLVVGDGATALFGPVLLLSLTGVSWYFRPAERKMVSPIHTDAINV